MQRGDTCGIGMAVLEVDLGNDLILGLKSLAERHYGDSGDASISRVVEDALEVRLLCLNRLREPGHEVEEPVMNWEFEGTAPPGQVINPMGDWLFGMREST